MPDLTFYREWLGLDKQDFRILAMLAEKDGDYSGTLSDMCRYFSLSEQSKNRAALKNAIQSLTERHWIESAVKGQKYCLRLCPKEKKIKMPAEWFAKVRAHEYFAAAVSWEAVTKVFLWLLDHDCDSTITNSQIADELNISESVVISAKNVLERDFDAITKRYVSEKIAEDLFIRTGQQINCCAWWK